jgi:osmoprotectant transport system permease protein
MIPLMGTGKTPALVALTILAVPPILINTIAGFAGIEASLYETARGMGMDEKQIFLKIEWPLALPLMLTGIRTSAVEVSASATIAAYIGAGGLGNIVFTGLGLNKAELLLIGGVSVAVISIGAELILGTVQNAVTKYQRD